MKNSFVKSHVSATDSGDSNINFKEIAMTAGGAALGVVAYSVVKDMLTSSDKKPVVSAHTTRRPATKTKK